LPRMTAAAMASSALPIVSSLHRSVLGNRASEGVDHECSQRQRCAGSRPVLLDGTPRLGDIHFDQAVHHVLVTLELQPVDLLMPQRREFDNPIGCHTPIDAPTGCRAGRA
jgi:hypothetical protein